MAKADGAPAATAALDLCDTLDDLSRAADWLAERLAGAELSEDTAFALRLCAEEALANVVMHAYDDDGGSHPMTLSLHLDAERAEITLEDFGRPFDPLAGATPQIAETLEDAAIGGRGLSLIRAYAPDLAYVRKDGANQLRMAFPLRSAKTNR